MPFGESGALTALVFGLMLGNKGHLSRYLRFKLPKVDSDDSMHNQLTFLVRTFFFVFVGLLASFGNIEYIIFGIVATVAIYVGRVILTKSTLTKRFSKLDRKVTSVMIPRGLAAAVLATFPLTMGLPNAEAYPQNRVCHNHGLCNNHNTWHGQGKENFPLQKAKKEDL